MTSPLKIKEVAARDKKRNISWSCQLWYQHHFRVLTLLTNLDTDFYWKSFIFKIGVPWLVSQFQSLPIFISCLLSPQCVKQIKRGCHLGLKRLLCVKLQSWSCQLWYQHPLWVLTLLAKQDTVFHWTTFIFKIWLPSLISHSPSGRHLSFSPVSRPLNTFSLILACLCKIIYCYCCAITIMYGAVLNSIVVWVQGWPVPPLA